MPSPQSAFGSDEAVPSSVMGSPTSMTYGPFASATGGLLPRLTSIPMVAMSVCAGTLSSVTRSAAVYVPNAG